MESIREIYKVGYGPSSSHTIGPRKAAEAFLSKNPQEFCYRVTLYGSLALTGKGHLTDKAIEGVFQGKDLEIVWEPTVTKEFHTNALLLEAFDKDQKKTDEALAYSVGGGRIIYDKDKDKNPEKSEDLYPFKSMDGVLDWTQKTGRSYWEYVFEVEDDGFYSFLEEI